MAINLNIISKFDDKGIQKIEGQLGGLGKSLGKLGGLIAGAFSVAAISNFAKEAVLGAEAAELASNRLSAVAKSMNVFGQETGKVTYRLNEFAEAQEFQLGVDADIIKAAQAKLFTFKELAKTAYEQEGAFDRATKAALDLAATGFGTAETNAIQLGKALNDPIKGITALARSGVTFTKEQKNMIKAMVETSEASAAVAVGLFETTKQYDDFIKAQLKAGQTGEQIDAIFREQLTPSQFELMKQLASTSDMLGAQEMVLKAIEEQVGGTAKATATASAKMTLAFNAMKDGVGEALLPAFESLTESLMPVIVDLGPKLGEIFTKLVPIIGRVAEILPSLIDALLPVADVFADFAILVMDLAADLMPVLIAVFEAFMPAIKTILPVLAEFLRDLIQPLVPALVALVTAFTPLLEAILPVLIELLEALLPIFTMLLDESLKALIPVITSLVAAFVPLLTAVLPVLVDLLTELVIPAIKAMGTVVSQVFGGVAKFIGEALGNTMTVLNTFAKSFESVWKGIGGFLKGIINGMLGMIQGLVNGVIDGVNLMIRALNKIKFTIPSWIPGIGGQNFGFTLPELTKIKIPQLAEGGIVMPKPGGTLANIAEAGRPEAVIPLDRLGNMGTTNKFSITVNAGMGADGTEIGRKIVDEIVRYEKSSGRVFARA